MLSQDFLSNPQISDCCKQESNHEVQVFGDITIRTCKVCGKRHFELAVDPLKVGLKFG